MIERTEKSTRDLKNEIKEITVFTNGDSSLLSTWSNVPYFFTETLIEKGIKVNRVDIGESSKYLVGIFKRLISPMVLFFCKKTTYNYFRSFIHYIEVRRVISKSVKKYADSDAFISLTFSFSAVGLTKKPVVIFSDWTYDYFFEYFHNRLPDFFEKTSINRENRQIKKASLVLPLFPSVEKKMKIRYPGANIHYLGNVLNAAKEPSPDVIKIKEKSQNILFIGRKSGYFEGAKQLLILGEELKLKFPDLSIQIIGMENSDFDYLPDFVQCYGYLDKQNPEQNSLYYKLLEEARLVINTTPQWGAFSSMIESMYFYNPVITTPYKEFIETFGSDITFGYYSDGQQLEDIVVKIELIFKESDYKTMCMSAHSAVENFTWSNYIDKVLQLIG